MKTIEERANILVEHILEDVDPIDKVLFAKLIKESYCAGANDEHAVLTRWHDPKVEQSEKGVCVLIKVADKFGNTEICLGTRCENEYITDCGYEYEINCDDEPTTEMKLVGWREIHE